MPSLFEGSFSQNSWWDLGIEWNTNNDIHNMIKDACDIYSLVFEWRFSSVAVRASEIKETHIFLIIESLTLINVLFSSKTLFIDSA